MLQYILTPEDLHGHYFRITLRLPSLTRETAHTLIMPSWIPGSYAIRDFAQHLSDICAYDTDTGESYPVLRPRKDTFIIHTQKAITVEYRLYAWRWCVRGAFLSTQLGFFNPIFCLQAKTCRGPIEIDCCWTQQTQAWQIYTALPQRRTQDTQGAYFSADDYDMMIDSPFLMGQDLSTVTFTTGGWPHTFVCNHNQAWPLDHEKLSHDLQLICSAHQAMFPGLSIPHYYFLGIVHEKSRGGLEHRNSTALIFQQQQLPLCGQTKRTEAYIDLLRLCSHEYFHLWWVKRVRPSSFQHYDLTQEQYTPLLGIFEGFTSYYEEQALLKTGLISPDHYCAELSKIITTRQCYAGDTHESLAEASRLAWIHHYQPNENTKNIRTNYYLKGMLLAFTLDLIITAHTEGRSRLAQPLTNIWHRHYASGQLLEDDTLAKSIQEMTGLDLSDIISEGLYGAQHLDCSPYLAPFHLSLSSTIDEQMLWSSLGVSVKARDGHYMIESVQTKSWAYAAGLAAGDELLALNGQQISDACLAYCLSMSDTIISCHFFRQGRLQQVTHQYSATQRSHNRWIMTLGTPNHLQRILFYQEKHL